MIDGTYVGKRLVAPGICCCCIGTAPHDEYSGKPLGPHILIFVVLCNSNNKPKSLEISDARSNISNLLRDSRRAFSNLNPDNCYSLLIFLLHYAVMAQILEEKVLRDKVKDRLRAEQIKLWDPPYTLDIILFLLLMQADFGQLGLMMGRLIYQMSLFPGWLPCFKQA
jgi:hypothetical protein